MKFEKFLKQVGTRGTIIRDDENGTWLVSGNVMLRIPENSNVVAFNERDMCDEFKDVIHDFYNSQFNEANLVRAYLPCGDSKASEIRRVFADSRNHNVEMSIDNKTFALIESGDGVYIKDGEEMCLIISEGYGDDETVVGLIFE